MTLFYGGTGYPGLVARLDTRFCIQPDISYFAENPNRIKDILPNIQPDTGYSAGPNTEFDIRPDTVRKTYWIFVSFLLCK